jgi:hypothetical protein
MRIVLLAIAILASSPIAAFAGWRRTGESPNATSYSDPNTIVRIGPMSRMWNMTDYRDQQSWSGYTFLSSKAEAEYDCAQPRWRIIVEYGFTGHMANGTTTYTVQGPRPWQSVSPGTIAEGRRNLACGL